MYSGKIPAMKNETRINIKEMLIETPDGLQSKKSVGGVGKPAHIRRWLDIGESNATAQMEKQGFSKVPLPHRVACWVILGFYKAPSNRDPFFIPKADADNAFTTLQETFKDTIMDDDRQVVDYHVSTRHFNNEQQMYSVAFVWTLPLEPHNYVDAMSTFMIAMKDLVNVPVWELLKNRKS